MQLRKVFNDYALKVLRNYPWRIKRDVLSFRQLETSDRDLQLVVLCKECQYLEGLWTLYSLTRFMGKRCLPVLIVDGENTKRIQESTQKLFSKFRTISLQEMVRRTVKPDKLILFSEHNWTGKKLLALKLLQDESNLIYADNDVIAFDYPSQLTDLVSRNSSPAYMYDPDGYIVDKWFWNRAKQLNIHVDNTFNAGFLWLPKGTLDQELIQSLLSKWQPEDNSHHAEQTLMSVLLFAKGAIALDRQEYLLSNKGYWLGGGDLDTAKLTVRHYVGPVRHRMYTSAYPYVYKQVKSHFK